MKKTALILFAAGLLLTPQAAHAQYEGFISSAPKSTTRPAPQRQQGYAPAPNSGFVSPGTNTRARPAARGNTRSIYNRSAEQKRQRALQQARQGRDQGKTRAEMTPQERNQMARARHSQFMKDFSKALEESEKSIAALNEQQRLDHEKQAAMRQAQQQQQMLIQQQIQAQMDEAKAMRAEAQKY